MSQIHGTLSPLYDVVGIGFGPANLALAAALRESGGGRGADSAPRALFLERKEGFGWHRGMLLDDATMQVSFLKDLVTLRNPASPLSFVSYLHSQGRLVDFINHKVMYPSRVEFHDYLEWSARAVDSMVRYGTEVTEVRPVTVDGVADTLEVVGRSAGAEDETVLCRTRNLVVATGLLPRLPEGVVVSSRVWHSSSLLPALEALPGPAPERFVVVGAGQSAAEAVDHLHRTHPRAEVCAVFSRYGYSPADDSPYANRIFDPGAVDDYYGAPQDVRDRLMAYHRNTNYAVVDLELIEELYRRAYQEKVQGRERLRMMPASTVCSLAVPPGEEDDRITVHVQNQLDGSRLELRSDAVVFATGYTAPDAAPLLGKAGPHCARDAEGRLRVARDYRVVTDDSLTAGIYLQGGTEHTHGITSSLLSMAAVRAGEIVDSVLARRTAGAPVAAEGADRG
ncbi:lysine N(6)-hydroxylase/L-ornithine N(5)-oxygenase family protein [Streptomyces lonarensis]|uniref:L-lysine N6-monooxygenase MbtG n=1 Tax=Streptomyces lonarensis TaxID=700599 RepID=A0A7X6CY32_9ACTN|nr:SidA/IucD/PvdA family monooxygenase [Streptomyces lonarensis]NJQ04668.1 SidA/IucD/PvdA family monooxygenase [Streptomyces lonarensis]